MKKLILFSICSFFAIATINAQGVQSKTYDYVPQMPEPTFDMNDFISHHLKYPKKAQETNIQGRVIVKFTVNAQGKVQNATIVRSANPMLDKEALRVVSIFPDFKPGVQDGKKVAVYYHLPINFKLDGNKG